MHKAAFGAFCLVFGLSAVAHAAPMRKFALVFGHNQGSSETVPLRYAESDVRKITSVLTELGGYRTADVLTLLGRDADDVLLALADIEQKIQAAEAEGAHTSLLVYYSGHAKVEDLLLGDTRLSMRSLREALTQSPADIKIGIIDSCDSGAITREKGGQRGPSFLLEADDRQATRGLILISSSSEDESSQESDELGGSFFTHYLASGLRGDADESGDRRVTLGEVYRYAYHKTVSVTANTRSGTQHPTYSYDLEGQGDIILTDISKGRSGVQFGPQLAGDFLVFDMDRQQVAAEISKTDGSVRRIALPPGEYVVKKRLTDHLRMSRFELADQMTYAVDESTMERVAFEDDYAKGVRVETMMTGPLRPGLRGLVMYQNFFGAAQDDLFPPMLLVGVGLELGPVFSGATVGLEAAFGSQSSQTLQLDALAIDYDFFQTVFSLSIIWGLDVDAFAFYAGPRLAGHYMQRNFPDDPLLSERTQDYFGLTPGVVAGTRWYIDRGRDFFVDLSGRTGFMAFGVDQNRSLFFGEVGLSVGYRP